MSGVGFERATQNRVIKLFADNLGYTYVGVRCKGADNSFVDEVCPLWPTTLAKAPTSPSSSRSSPPVPPIPA